MYLGQFHNSPTYGAEGDVLFITVVEFYGLGPYTSPMKKTPTSQYAGQVLEHFHFEPIDRGTSIETTPLKQHERSERDLASEVATRYGISEAAARLALADAVAEVVSIAPPAGRR